jgi:acetylornithine deacetylase/succinyl-diaminopimelate desuccinylase-like protein
MSLPAVLAHLDADRAAALDRLLAFLRIGSVSTDPAFAPEMRRAAEHLAADLSGIGFEAKVYPTTGHPMVVAKRVKGGGRPHVLFYGHYDVQPVDPLDLWEHPPFEPFVADGRIRGRGAADDKGQLMTFVEACRAYMAIEGELPIDVTCLFEGEEESGSASLPAFLDAHADLLKADVALVCDTGMWDENTPSISTMLRGIAREEIVIRCADRDMHSGLYGGPAWNPIRIVSKIVGDLHDAQGRVTIPGFYEGVDEVPTQVKAMWDGLGVTPETYLGPVGLKTAAGEKGRSILEQIWSRPTAEPNGIIGGYTGEGTKTVIPAQASAKFTFRLVGKQNPDKVIANFRAFVEARLPPDATVEYLGGNGSPAIHLDIDDPPITIARDALAAEWGTATIMAGQGGSIPIVGDFQRVLGLNAVMVGFGLKDDRIHSPNEKYELRSFQKGARSWARILAGMAGRKAS